MICFDGAHTRYIWVKASALRSTAIVGDRVCWDHIGLEETPESRGLILSRQVLHVKEHGNLTFSCMYRGLHVSPSQNPSHSQRFKPNWSNWDIFPSRSRRLEVYFRIEAMYIVVVWITFYNNLAQFVQLRLALDVSHIENKGTVTRKLICYTSLRGFTFTQPAVSIFGCPPIPPPTCHHRHPRHI